MLSINRLVEATQTLNPRGLYSHRSLAVWQSHTELTQHLVWLTDLVAGKTIISPRLGTDGRRG